MNRGPGRLMAGAAALLLLPFLHPILIPVVGVPSHLLWFVHVLPVAMLTYTDGRRTGLVAVMVSAGLVVTGERLLGAGFFQSAPWETALSLGVAVTFTNVLLLGFALYARRVTARYRLLFDESATGIVQTTENGRVEAANPIAEGLLASDSLEGRSLLGVLGSDLRSMAELESKGGWPVCVEVGEPGYERDLYLVVTALRSDALDAGYHVLVADRSTEVLQQREIERSARLATLGEALAGVAHELKNPLTTIRGFAELGRDEAPPSGEARSMFATIKDEADRMTGLVQELLGYSRPRPDGECTRLDEVVCRVTRMQRIALGKDVRLVDRIEARGEVPVRGARIEQILLNLITNAADAGGSGVTLTVTVRRTGERFEVEVADDGPGIAADVIETIFEPFFTTKPEGVGTGLGLAISRRLARAMGGDLTARNIEPRGAVFTLTVPIARAPTGEKGAAPTDTDTPIRDPTRADPMATDSSREGLAAPTAVPGATADQDSPH